MIKRIGNKTLKTNQSGMTLLEVLISLLVLSIGMVGLGALLLTALTNVHSSSQYSLASALALDFEERLWFEIANISAVDPDALLNGCLTEDHINEVRRAMVDQWTRDEENWDWTTTGADRFQAPNLAVTVGGQTVTSVTRTDPSDGTVINTQIRWQFIDPVTIAWRESRFDLADETEKVEVSIGLVCRPTFN